MAVNRRTRKILKSRTARGSATRYSCPYSTVPDKRRAPPKV